MEQVGGTIGPAYAIRLGQVRGKRLEAICWCEHTAAVDVEALIARWTEHERLVQLEDRLRCTKCGARAPVACRFRVTV